MKATARDPFASSSSNWVPPENLIKLAEPAHQVIAEFIHGCSTDEATRTAATTAFVMSVWQLQGIRITESVPSLLLVNAGKDEEDPIDGVIRGLVHNPKDNEPRVQTAGPFAGGSIELAKRAMRSSLGKRRRIGNVSADRTSQVIEARNLEERFHAASITAHGCGYSRPYSEAWHPEYGLLTDMNGQIILRLNDDKDRQAMAGDIKDNPVKLGFPEGVGRNLFPVAKHITLSGSVTRVQARNVAQIVAMGIPVLMVPHTGSSPLAVKNMPGLRSFAHLWLHAVVPPVPTSFHLPASDWNRTYRDVLQKRLARLPYDYSFAIQQALHHLDGVCDRIVWFSATPPTPKAELAALASDLYSHSLRGLTLSVVGLAWFGWGIELSPEAEPLRGKAIELLKRARKEGGISMTACLKNLHLNANQRDMLIEGLTHEGLIRVEGKDVVATTYREFVTALYQRPEFPAVQRKWRESSLSEKPA